MEKLVIEIENMEIIKRAVYSINTQLQLNYQVESSSDSITISQY